MSRKISKKKTYGRRKSTLSSFEASEVAFRSKKTYGRKKKQIILDDESSEERDHFVPKTTATRKLYTPIKMQMPVRRRSAKKKSLFKDLDSPFPEGRPLRNLENVPMSSPSLSSPVIKDVENKKKKKKKKGYLNRVKRRRKKNKKMKRRLITTTRLQSVREVDLEWIYETLEKSAEDCVYEGLRCAKISLPVEDWTTQRVFRVTHALLKHIDFREENEKKHSFYTDWYGLDNLRSVLNEALDERRRGDVETQSSISISTLGDSTIDAIVSQEREVCKESMRRLRRASFGPNMMAMIQHRRSSLVPVLPRMSVLPSGRPSALVPTKPTRQTTSRISSVATKEIADVPICSPAMSTASCLSAVFEFLNTKDLLHVAPLVTSTWWSVAKRVRSWQAAQIAAHYTPVSILDCWENLCEAFPRGKFLAEGAFKKVYRVYAKPNNRTEAVAVMNVRRICEDGQADMVRKELHAGLSLSELSSNEICPHYVEWYQIFQFAYPPPEELWNRQQENEDSDNDEEDEDVTIPSAPIDSKGAWQYIRMELCDGSDVETFLRGLAENDLYDEADPKTCAALFLQMLVSLDVGIERYHLRHYDIKLLNFMLKRDRSCTRYRLGEIVYDINSEEDASGYITKLADWGTADTEENTLNNPINSAVYTTLENTPPEFMLLGSNATQGYEADAWALGLCWLHLLAVDAPYEEIMEEIKCPISLFRELCKIWCCPNDKKSSYYVLWQGALEYAPNVRTLADTLWRQLVMCGNIWEKLSENPVVRLLRNALKIKKQISKTSRRRRANNLGLKCFGELSGRGNVWDQLVRDRKEFCLLSGTEWTEVRDRAKGAGFEVLKGLLCADAGLRLTVRDVLQDHGETLFGHLRKGDDKLVNCEVVLR